MENIIKQIKESQKKLKSITKSRDLFIKKIESLKKQIANNRKAEKEEREYLSRLAKQYAAEVSTDFANQSIVWNNQPRMRSKIYGHGANLETAYN